MLTELETAAIQSFPKSYFFEGGRVSLCKQIGNAVPPKMSAIIAFEMNKSLWGKYNGF